MSRSEILAPLRQRNFRWFFVGETLNNAGTFMAGIALAFAVLEVDDSPSALGYVLAAHSIPLVVFLLLGGVVADRFGRRLVIQGSNLVSGLSQAVTAALVISGQAQLWQLIVLAGINGTVAAAGFPALMGLVPQLVDRAHLQQANVLQSMMRGGLRIVAPSVSALLVATVGPGWSLAVDAATWFASAAVLTLVRIPRATPAAPQSVVADLREGWGIFWGTTWLWVVVLAFMGLNMLHGWWNVLGPAIAEDSFGAQGWGLIASADAIGLLMMTLVLSRVRLERPLMWGVLGCFAYLLPLGVLGARPEVVPLIIAAFIAGAGIEVFGLGWNLAMQEHIPEDKLSRAYSYDALGSFAAIPLGQLMVGPLAESFGASPVLLTGFIVSIVLVLAMLSSASVRGLRRVPIAEPAHGSR
ncbi:MAG: MFS transporter [Nocardioides sp.]